MLMPTIASSGEIQSDFDTIARLTPESDVLGPHEAWLLAQLPAGRGTALEIGCGVGQLARRRTAEDAPIEYICADMSEWLRAHHNTYDCIVTVATLHHVSLRSALHEMARSLKPGGRLLVLDLFDRSGWRYLLINAVAFLVARAREVVVFRGMRPWKLRLAYWRHGRKETYLNLPNVERVAREELPAAKMRAHLSWRYSILWDKPDVSATTS